MDKYATLLFKDFDYIITMVANEGEIYRAENNEIRKKKMMETIRKDFLQSVFDALDEIEAEADDILKDIWPQFYKADRIYNDKKVIDDMNTEIEIGDYVAENIIDDLAGCLPPTTYNNNLFQVGEPFSHRLDEKRQNYRATYATYKAVGDGVWEYCGHCFRGETKERGQDILVV